MASENLRSTSKKMQKEITKELGAGSDVATKLITFIEASLRDQQSFIENQFPSFVGRLDRIQADISTCTADIKTLQYGKVILLCLLKTCPSMQGNER